MSNHLGLFLWLISGIFFFLSTLYYFLELIPAYIKHRKVYLNPKIITNQELKELFEKNHLEFPRIKFQITTRGNEVLVVKRGIKSIYEVSRTNPLFKNHFELLIVSDEYLEKEIFHQYLRELGVEFPAEIIIVPSDYKTKNNTYFKARSLQYSIEYRKSKKMYIDKHPAYIFYFDAESTIDEIEFRRILQTIIFYPNKRIFEGPIVYPHRYFESNLISRQMEASRPFNCHHCIQVMNYPPPLHLHGSNLLVDEKIIEEIGWDYGTIANKPLLAEDLIFGLIAYSKYGGEVFGWHGGRLLEQPPLTIKSSVKARIRWITGTWQALKLLGTRKEYKSLTRKKKMEIQFRIRLRIITHSLSFFAAFFVIFSGIMFLFPSLFAYLTIDPNLLSPSFRTFQFIVTRLVFIPGTLFWIFGIINGSSKNLEVIPNLRKSTKILEQIKLLLITPFAGAIESFSALYATTRWIIGKPHISWTVTKK